MSSMTIERKVSFAGASAGSQRSGGAEGLVRILCRSWSRWRTARILNGLDDAGLKDIGLQRGMIDSAFQDHRYSPRF
jgi:uncharacterized protein YjiS (DUF1127 family)